MFRKSIILTTQRSRLFAGSATTSSCAAAGNNSCNGNVVVRGASSRSFRSFSTTTPTVADQYDVVVIGKSIAIVHLFFLDCGPVFFAFDFYQCLLAPHCPAHPPTLTSNS